MRRVSTLVLVLAACEGGQSPASENIALAEVTCVREDDRFSFHAEARVTLDVGQTFVITFLNTIQEATFSRTIMWECDEHTPTLDLRGCERTALDPAQAMASVTEIYELVQGEVPSTFEFTTVASITDMLRGIEVENVLLRDVCP